MKKIIAVVIILFLCTQGNVFLPISAHSTPSSEFCMQSASERNLIDDIVTIPQNNPLFGLLGSYVCCWYESTAESGLKPLLVHDDTHLSTLQYLFLDQYFSEYSGSILTMGSSLETSFETTEILGNITDISLQLAPYVFSLASTIIIIPKQLEYYTLSLTASPLASYLNCPIIIFENNSQQIHNVCTQLSTTNAIIIGDISVQLPGITCTQLETIDDIQTMMLSVIKTKFQTLSYLTLTNPADIIPSLVVSSHTTIQSDHLSNVKITVFSKEFNIKGNDTKQFTLSIPSGIQHVQIFGNISSQKHRSITPIISLKLYDPLDNLVAYSSSPASQHGSAYLQTLITNASGDYRLEISIYRGIRGGYFSQRGISFVDTDFDITSTVSTLEKPHLPFIPKLSMQASYLTAAHGGIILADPCFELTDENYEQIAQGYSSGPWHHEDLHLYNNQKVEYVLNQLNNTLETLDDFDLLTSYLSGPAWCAILAGTNMIPMYYYSPSQPGIIEKGLPSDNPYSLNWNLSVSRVIGWNIEDVSTLIARTLFYEEILTTSLHTSSWHDTFHFIFGEGFGETGGIFHQIPYAKEIQQYGFDTTVYGDFRNGRGYAEVFNVYTGANYIEYLGHGDWFWYTPSLYGLDIYSKAIDVAHAKEWIYENPSIFLTSACLMGRIDGISPRNNIGLTMLRAGCNAFVGATRETGQEAGLERFENHLLIDDYSIGEALREEKRVDKELPTYYVRVLFGDPAFNPYEPNNGFSNQGRPFVIH